MRLNISIVTGVCPDRVALHIQYKAATLGGVRIVFSVPLPPSSINIIPEDSKRHNTVHTIVSRPSKQSGRSPKVVAVFLLQTLVAIWYDFFHCIVQSKWNQSLLPNLVAFISQKEKNVWFFNYHLLTCSVRKMVFICLMQNIDMCLLYKSHQIARLALHLINHFSK